MNVLFLNAYFYPENIAFTHLEHDILEALVRAGHTVDVICPVPSRGVDAQTKEKYKSITEEELFGGSVRVHRFPLADEPQGGAQRALRYILCDMKLLKRAKKFKNADLVFSVSTPPTQGIFAGRAAKKLGVGCVYNVQDIFPDSLVSTGLSGDESLLYKIGRKIEDKTYSLTDKIIVISDEGKQNLLNKGVPQSKLVTVTNWTDTSANVYVPRDENRLFDELKIPRDKFTVVYAGSLGASQNSQVIIEAANLLKGEKGIQFVVFGAGICEAQTRAAAEELGLDNVIFFPLQSPERVPEVYSMGDACLVTCKKGTGRAGVPSKTWTIMACSRPLLLSFDSDSELSCLIAGNKLGLCADAGDSEGLADCIKKMFADSELCSTLGKNGRDYVEHNASSDICPDMYVAAMEASVK